MIDHKINGYVIEDGNCYEFAKGVLYLIDNPVLAKRLGLNTQKMIKHKFSWSHRAKEVMAVYDHVRYAQHSNAR